MLYIYIYIYIMHYIDAFAAAARHQIAPGAPGGARPSGPVKSFPIKSP